MNFTTIGRRANAQHRTDDALGIWKASGKGMKRVHENFDGWQLRTNTRRTWTVHRPDGTQVGGPWGSLWIAKYEVTRLMNEA